MTMILSIHPYRMSVGKLTLMAVGLSIGIVIVAAPVEARPKQNNASAAPLGAAGEALKAKYQARLDALKSQIAAQLPEAGTARMSTWKTARQNLEAAKAALDSANKDLGSVHGGKALIDHAKGKWIGGAEKGIAQAKAALAKASNDAERAAAQKDLAKWEENKQEGLKALKERTEAYESAKRNEAKFRAAQDSAKAALARAEAAEQSAADAVLSELSSVLDKDGQDDLLVEAALLAHATPRGLAEYAAQGPDKEALVDKLLADRLLMKDMLMAGGARFGQYGKAMEIYCGIQKASSKTGSGHFQRLSLGTALEHAKPVILSRTGAGKGDDSTFVDPVKRYLHYEAASLAGELDPAFPYLTTWEYRHVVNCDAPDEILSWGREMLRNYRPDHIYHPDYGWRYVSAVRTEVPYGSQNVHLDDPSRHNYQNIIRNGGICGRRAFFGRFILRSFGIPTWGVTQKAHAALSHWTPKGWVVNLGAGYAHSWWDKDDVSLSGTQFLRETQARVHENEYIRVLRAQWVSRILGEEAYNERRKIAGGVWSQIANHLTGMLASKSSTLGSLGQDLAEANDKEQKIVSEAVSAEEQKVSVGDGNITIPSVAHGKSSGKAAAMKSITGGMQLHALGGYETTYEFDAAVSGNYLLTAKVATVQTDQVFLLGMNGSEAVECAVPYTLGMWEDLKPVSVTLQAGRNVLRFALKAGSRGVTIKDFTLTPVR